MKYALFIAGIFALFTFNQCKVNKLIIKTDDGKFKIKEDMSLAVTAKGETYPFNLECESICKECDLLFNESRWDIDSIGETSMKLRNELSYDYDTIPQRAFRKRSKYSKKTYLEKVISLDKKAYYIFKVPIDVNYKTVKYDSISDITYSYKPECYKGAPIRGMFANPNKIRRVHMQDGYEIKCKLK